MCVLLVLTVMFIPVSVKLNFLWLPMGHVNIQGVIASLRAAILPHEENQFSIAVALPIAADAVPKDVSLLH